jgi:hypothetical protein
VEMRSGLVQERLAVILRDTFHDHRVREDAPELCRHILAYARRPAGMVRARLLLATAEAYGKEIDTGMYDLAAATELLHLFALIHDDEIDALERPGIDHPSHLDDDQGGGGSGAVRVLAGDLVHAVAQATLRRVVMNHGFPMEILVLVEDIAIKTISGQMLEIRFRDDPTTLDRLFTLYDMKTGYYSFVAPLCIGALCGDHAAATDDREALTRTGLALGRAFQLQDDLKDVLALHGRPANAVRPWEYNLVHALDPTMRIPPEENDLARLRQLAEPVLHDLTGAAHRESLQLSLSGTDRHTVLETAGAVPPTAGAVSTGGGSRFPGGGNRFPGDRLR